MSELTKNQLKTDNNNSFPDNTSGYITPEILRNYNVNMIDSLVDEVSYNVDSASWNSQIGALQSFSSSLDATFATDAQLTAVSAALDTAKVNVSQTASMSVLSASYATTASYAANATIDTSSFAKTNVNNSFNGTQTFNNVIVSGTASVALLNVTYESSSVIYSSGSNILGDASNDTQTLWGTVRLPSGPLSVTGSVVANKVSALDFDTLFLGSQMGGTTADGTFNGFGSATYTNTIGAYAGGFDNELQTLINSTGIYLKDFNGSGYSNFLKLLPNTGTNPAPQFTRGLGVTGSLGVTGNTTLGDATTDTTTINGSTTINGNGEATVALSVVSGSVEITGPRGNGGHFYSNLPITSSNGRINGTFVVKDLIVSGTWGGEGSGSLTVENISTFNGPVTASAGVFGTASYAVTASYAMNGGGSINTGSFATTGSNTFTGTQTLSNGNLIVGADPTTGIYNGAMISKTGLNYTIYNVSTGSAAFNLAATDGIGFSYSTELLATATPSQFLFQDFSTGDYSYKTWLAIPQNTGGNPAPQFKRGATISGSFTAVNSATFNGTTVFNAALTSSAARINGQIEFGTGGKITGSYNVTGSVNGAVTALSVASSTASLDLNAGNFFTLQLVSGSSVNINPTNIKPGQTISILLNTTGSGTVTFPSSVKQQSGSAYVPTTSTSKDIITLISYDSTTLYLTSIRNLV